MKIKEYIAIILIFLIVLVITIFSLLDFIQGQEFDNLLFKENKNENPIENSNQLSLDKKFDLGSGVVPHHLAAREIIDNFWQNIAVEKPETIILLSPDHFYTSSAEQTNGLVTVNLGSQYFYNFKIDNQLLLKLAEENEFICNDSYLALDHGLTAHFAFIKKYLPETKILPFLIPENVTSEQIKIFTQGLAKNASAKSSVIASVDFSHYLPKIAADFHDAKSIAALINFQKDEFSNLEVDCWQCLYSARLFTRLRGKENYQVLAHNNSVDFLKAGDQESTTSYFSLIFNQGTMPKTNEYNVKTILFVGDMMLDRGVEELMKKNSIYYPFEQINQLMRGIDIVFGNLEGPIIKNPPYTPPDSLQFSFRPEVIDALKFAKIDLVSLANNHTLNMGKDGLKQTKEFLSKAGIAYVGDPIKCSQESVYIDDNFAILAFNKTYAECKVADIVKTIEEVKKENADKFIIVAIHWGKEYKKTNTEFQQKTGQQIIDAGADLIIGHHPHVVENIEQYKGKLIFYSLGNFIFDQYFSRNTQEGVAVGLEINPNKLIFRLFPYQLDLSQPRLMEAEKKDEFLQALAGKSDEKLKEQIKNGIIELNR